MKGARGGGGRRDEKVKVLRSVPPVTLQDSVLGQYTAGSGMAGYLDDDSVPEGSVTPTFAMCVLHIDNDRWHGVPFILKAGKVLYPFPRHHLPPPPNRHAYRPASFVARMPPDDIFSGS